ncbi:hypothetical protein AN167_26630, partial [Vibrio splendidus]
MGGDEGEAAGHHRAGHGLGAEAAAGGKAGDQGEVTARGLDALDLADDVGLQALGMGGVAHGEQQGEGVRSAGGLGLPPFAQGDPRAEALDRGAHRRRGAAPAMGGNGLADALAFDGLRPVG